MKTLAIIFALAGGITENNSSSTTELKGLHFIITVDNSENLDDETKNIICDTLENSSYALFKSKDYILACRNNNRLQEKGVKSEVKAFFNDEEITMDDAYVFMNNRNFQEAKEYAEYSRNRIEQIILENEKVEMYYSITVSMKNDTEILKSQTDKYSYALKESTDKELIVFGKFLTFQDVKSVYDELLAAGITDVGITASEFGREIPVSNAVGKEQIYLEQLLAINK